MKSRSQELENWIKHTNKSMSFWSLDSPYNTRLKRMFLNVLNIGSWEDIKLILAKMIFRRLIHEWDRKLTIQPKLCNRSRAIRLWTFIIRGYEKTCGIMVAAIILVSLSSNEAKIETLWNGFVLPNNWNHWQKSLILEKQLPASNLAWWRKA